jgi:hypothetical protein
VSYLSQLVHSPDITGTCTLFPKVSPKIISLLSLMMGSLLDSKASTKENEKILRGVVMIPFEFWIGLAAVGMAISVGVMA